MERRQQRKERSHMLRNILFGIGLACIGFLVLFGVMTVLVQQIEKSADYQAFVELMQDADVSWTTLELTLVFLLFFISGMAVTLPEAVKEGLTNQLIGANDTGNILSVFGIDLNQVLEPLSFRAEYGSPFLSIFGIGLFLILFLVLRIGATRVTWTIRTISFLAASFVLFAFTFNTGLGIDVLTIDQATVWNGIFILLFLTGLFYLVFYPRQLSGVSAAARAAIIILMVASSAQLFFTVTDEAKYEGDASTRTWLTVSSLNAGSDGWYDLMHGSQVTYKANVLGARLNVPVTFLNGETDVTRLKQSMEDVVNRIDAERVTNQLLTVIGGERPDLSNTRLTLDAVDYGTARNVVLAMDARSAGQTAAADQVEQDKPFPFWLFLIVPFVVYLLVSIRAFKKIYDPVVFAVATGLISWFICSLTGTSFALLWQDDALVRFSQETATVTTILYATVLALIAGFIGYAIKRQHHGDR
ncbi:hypothetical protein [Exiguobacterium sp. S90]|uniref:hypothetical protein n=1 Tax=Exiguobacterium sp. S90 TaxID=1221231 RepID=UPI001BE64961|nr:hypothetical protein [Exiguobacterium sp. S90]